MLMSARATNSISFFDASSRQISPNAVVSLMKNNVSRIIAGGERNLLCHIYPSMIYDFRMFYLVYKRIHD